MAAPRDILDALESVVSLYFSDVRQKLRAAFILTDELVEMTCKAPAIAANPTLGHIKFHDLLKHPAVKLDAKTTAHGATLLRNHDTRNKMQHVNAAFTVDDQHCADAILDAVQTIDHCFPGSSPAFPEVLKVALRVVRLHSTQGNAGQRGRFEDAMREWRWKSADKRTLRKSEIAVTAGNRRHWGMVMPEYAQVENILNGLGIP